MTHTQQWADGVRVHLHGHKHTHAQTHARAHTHTQEWGAAKARQDAALSSIEAGLGTLAAIGGAMNDSLGTQAALVDAVEEKARIFQICVD